MSHRYIKASISHKLLAKIITHGEATAKVTLWKGKLLEIEDDNNEK